MYLKACSPTGETTGEGLGLGGVGDVSLGRWGWTSWFQNPMSFQVRFLLSPFVDEDVVSQVLPSPMPACLLPSSLS